MWSDALCWQSHGSSVLTPKGTHKDLPCKGLSVCRPFAGKEPTEATREFLEEVDTADRIPCSTGSRRPARQIRHSHHFIC